MAQAHGDRLTAVDASFLAQESQNAHMHIGAVTVFEGPPPAFDDFADHVRGRLHLVPRYRQKLAVPAARDRAAAVGRRPELQPRVPPAPHRAAGARLRGAAAALAARIHSQRLDRDKPLWELWLVQGLEDGRFALISKTHHALVDGVAGVDLATVLFDLEPVPTPMPHEGEPWVPQPEPSAASLAARGVRGLVELPFSLAGRALRARRQARDVAARGARGGRGRRRDRVGGPQPGARHAAERADRPAPAARDDPQRAGRVQARQVRLRRHGQRRRADRRRRRPAALAPVARRPHRGARAARAGPGVDPRRRRARPAGQPARRHARAAAGLRRGPGCPAALRAPGDGRAQGVQAGGRRRGAHERPEPRAADGARAGLADQLLHAPVQPARHQRARARSSRSTRSAASSTTCSPSPSCRATTRSRWRSCPTTAAWTSACSATTTRCPTSTRSARCSRSRATSCSRGPRVRARTGAGLVAQRELRVLGHLLRRPRGRDCPVAGKAARSRSSCRSSPARSALAGAAYRSTACGAGTEVQRAQYPLSLLRWKE